MFNGWYWLWLTISIGSTIGLYFLLRKRSQKTQKIVLFSILVLGLVAHFTKFLYPPYSTDYSRLLRDSWFINICGANIFLFPFFFLSKSDKAKDYMFYLGLLGGLISVLYPLEPMQKANQAGEWIDIIRFYFHHTMLYAVPLLMVVFGMHKLSYKRVLWCPAYLLCVMLFIMLNQVLQSELGFIPLRNNDMTNINYKNSSLIWGPGSEKFAVIFTAVCPKIFKTIPVGEYAGQEKYWPWFWLIVPAFLYLTPICFGLCMIFDHKNFRADFSIFAKKLKQKFGRKAVIITQNDTSQNAFENLEKRNESENFANQANEKNFENKNSVDLKNQNNTKNDKSQKNTKTKIQTENKSFKSNTKNHTKNHKNKQNPKIKGK